MRILRYFLFLIFLGSGEHHALAAASAATIKELFRYGHVEKTSSAYRIADKSGLFVKIVGNGKSRCLHLDQPGNYSLVRLRKEFDKPTEIFEFFNCNLQALVLRLKSPARMVVTPKPRGINDEPDQNGESFEEIWKQVVRGRTSTIPSENLLAAAVWFSGEKENHARSAFILEKAYKQYRNKWFLQLHHNAYAMSSPSLIDEEVENTRNELESFYSPESNIALLIGIQNYKKDSGWSNLQTPLNDVERLKNVLVTEYRYNRDNIYLLRDPTYQDIMEALRQIRNRVGKNTNLLVFFAGHGFMDEDGEYFWIPSDGSQSTQTWIYTDLILKKIKNLNTLHTLLVVDSCFSGALNNNETRGPVTEGVKKLYRKNSRQLITAGGNEPVADGGGAANSVFARSFLEILGDQPEDQPLSTQELFARLQPRVLTNSNQTPTYDRIPNSRDQWGQFYFIKNPHKMTLIDSNPAAPKANQTATVEDLPAEIINDVEFSQSGDGKGEVAELFLQRQETTVNMGEILDSENITMLGGAISFGLRYKAQPMLFQFKCLTGRQELSEDVVYKDTAYLIPRTINRVDLRIGFRFKLKELKDRKRWLDEAGIYFYWKRMHLDWNTSLLEGEETSTEFIHLGHYFLDLQGYSVWKVNPLLEFGLNQDLRIGLVNLSGSTQNARSEKYKMDVSNLVLGLTVSPEMRFRFPLIRLELRLGGSYEYLWQPLDDRGGSQSGNNKINTSQSTTRIHATFGLGF